MAGRGKRLVRSVRFAEEVDVFKSLDQVIVERGIKHPDNKSNDETKNENRPKLVIRRKDPLTHSLDELVPRGNEGDVKMGKRKLGDADERQGASNKDKGGVIVSGQVEGRFPKRPLTPYRAIILLSEQNLLVEMTIGRRTRDGDKSRLWHCEVSRGNIIGKSESVRKVVAREMASLQFLKALKANGSMQRFPNYTVPNELFIDPKVFHLLAKLAEDMGLPLNHDVTIQSGAINDYYACTISTGNDEFHGESNVLEYAKLIAAKAAYESLTGEEFPPTLYFTGNECLADAEYEFMETEVYQPDPIIKKTLAVAQDQDEFFLTRPTEVKAAEEPQNQPHDSGSDDDDDMDISPYGGGRGRGKLGMGRGKIRPRQVLL